ncbi:uncharacterized protein LOC125861233 [Solanum stenotomum]|uniref:uncharacterized protein LOC125861233 n=1 Tax=Solanum stenotomum TaxID=172797 RepID=UPI0020D1CE5A|nr:uncharacterized protein LOC125861233 [Solanum stenotomum]
MPPRRAVKSCPARRNVETREQRVPNAPEVQPQGEVNNAEFWEAIQMLIQAMTNQFGQRENQQDLADTSRIFAYQMNGVARIWSNQWKKNRFEGAPLVSWVLFEEAFLGHFFPRELKEAKKKQNGPASSSASAPAPRNIGEFNHQNFRARPAHSQDNMAQEGNKTFACDKYGRSHSGVCRDGSTGCFKCGQNSHFMTVCPKNRQRNGKGVNKAQSSLVAPPDRVASRGATSGAGGGGNCMYVITNSQEQENALNATKHIVATLWP